MSLQFISFEKKPRPKNLPSTLSPARLKMQTERKRTSSPHRPKNPRSRNSRHCLIYFLLADQGLSQSNLIQQQETGRLKSIAIQKLPTVQA